MAKEDPKEMQELDQVMHELAKEGVTYKNYTSRPAEGLGDLLESAFAKFGITEESVKKWPGMAHACRCNQRKEFLNKLMPFKRK